MVILIGTCTSGRSLSFVDGRWQQPTSERLATSDWRLFGSGAGQDSFAPLAALDNQILKPDN